MALNVGSRIAHYDVTALIGEGGMGQVYRARDTKLDKDVAPKIQTYDQGSSDSPTAGRSQAGVCGVWRSPRDAGAVGPR